MDFIELSNSLLLTLKRYQSILIYIKGSPDPDVIGASFALKSICDALEIKSDIVSLTNVSLPQNQALIDNLNIPIRFSKSLNNISHYDAYAVLDHQSAYVQDVSEEIPCVIHIDHHEPVQENISVDIKIVSQDVGSVSTIMTLLLQKLDLDIGESLLSKIATALMYGIQTDTDSYTHATHLDYEALNYLSIYSDKKIIEDITGLPLSEKSVKLFGIAIRNQLIYKDWLITGIGIIDESNRDSIALIADFLLKKQDISTVIVFSAIRSKRRRKLTLDASIRTRNANLKLNELIKRISSDGGARRFKGAYQVNLDYFLNSPNEEILWELISQTTIDLLKRQRDTIHIIELKGLFKKLRKRIGALFE